MINKCKIVFGKPGEKISLEKPRRRRDNNIKNVLEDIGW
jgi:hypothetical protein